MRKAVKGNAENIRDAMLVEKYILLSDIGLSYDDLRKIPYEEAKELLKVHQLKKEYEQEQKEEARRKMKRRRDS